MTINLYTTKQAAQSFRVNNDTMLRWAKEAGVEPAQHGATRLFTEEQLAAIRQHRSRSSIYNIGQAAAIIRCRYDTANELAKFHEIGKLKPPKFIVRELTDADVALLSQKVQEFRDEEAKLRKQRREREQMAFRTKAPLVSTQPAVSYAVPDVVYEEQEWPVPVCIEEVVHKAVYLRRADTVPPSEGIGYQVDRRQMRPCSMG